MVVKRIYALQNVFKNELNTSNCTLFRVTFSEPPSIVPGTQTSTTIIENNRVVLPCPARGTPPPKIKWFKNGVALSGNEIGERVLPDGSLQVEHASSNHTGNYRCVAENVAGNVTFNIELTVFGMCVSISFRNISLALNFSLSICI